MRKRVINIGTMLKNMFFSQTWFSGENIYNCLLNYIKAYKTISQTLRRYNLSVTKLHTTLAQVNVLFRTDNWYYLIRSKTNG